MFDFLKKIDFNAIGNVITLINPVAGLVVKSIDAIVNSDNETISNESVIKVVKSLSNSKGNNADSELVSIVSEYLNKSK